MKLHPRKHLKAYAWQVEVLEDLIAAAVNDAVRRVEQASQEKMSGLTSGLNIPGLNIPSGL